VTEELPIYELLGAAKLEAIVAAFYRRIPQDDVLGPMYPPGDLEGAERRLSSFLLFRFGGPQTYLAERGHPRLRMRHAPFAVDANARDRWMALMMAAIDEVGVAAEIREYLERFLGDIATFLQNR
jgi:hemoglobin